MSYEPIGLGDFTNNKYAGAMKELANGLSSWSAFLLFPFIIYHLISNDSASLISLKSFLVIILGEVVFVIASRIANIVFAALVSLIILPFGMKDKVVIAQNIQTTILVVFGLFLCAAAWFFASYAVNYAYSA